MSEPASSRPGEWSGLDRTHVPGERPIAFVNRIAEFALTIPGSRTPDEPNPEAKRRWIDPRRA
jgi:hypothetical protein